MPIPTPSVPLPDLRTAVRAAIPPFHVMDVWAAAGERRRTHGDLVNLSAGLAGSHHRTDIAARAAKGEVASPTGVL